MAMGCAGASVAAGALSPWAAGAVGAVGAVGDGGDGGGVVGAGAGVAVNVAVGRGVGGGGASMVCPAMAATMRNNANTMNTAITIVIHRLMSRRTPWKQDKPSLSDETRFVLKFGYDEVGWRRWQAVA